MALFTGYMRITGFPSLEEEGLAMRRIVAIWTVVMALMAGAFDTRMVGATPMPTCASCREAITSNYVQYGRHVFHPQHFVCAVCRQPIGNGSFVPHQGQPYHHACYVEAVAERCGICRKPLTGQFIKKDGKSYHEGCFQENLAERCGICRKPLVGKFIKKDDQSYHEGCYQNVLAEKCDVCKVGITGQFFVDPWGNKYHAAHQKQVPNCEYCGRVISARTSSGGYTYNDGRSVCGICYQSQIANDRAAKPLVAGVRDRMNQWGIEVPESAAPVILVDRGTLRNLLRRTGHSAGPNVNGFTSVLTEKKGSEIVKREMAVYILYGMPRELFEGTVAHELTHVWVNLHNGRKLDSAFEEGSCNYVKYLLHKDSDTELAPYAIKSMQQDRDPAYGQGFRRAKAYVERHGLPALLNNLARSTGFPFGY